VARVHYTQTRVVANQSGLIRISEAAFPLLFTTQVFSFKLTRSLQTIGKLGTTTGKEGAGIATLGSLGHRGPSISVARSEVTGRAICLKPAELGSYRLTIWSMVQAVGSLSSRHLISLEP
jgi:hypothetical protein